MNHSPIEKIKKSSKGLRGSLIDGINNEITRSLNESDQFIIKFHGVYQQDNRERRKERAFKKLERSYSFMIRLRLPGGFLTPKKWVIVDSIACKKAKKTIKITSRQTFQLHGIIKSKIKPTVKAFNLAGLDSLATCGDINRNVICSTQINTSPAFYEIFHYAKKISLFLLPKTRAYYEIWLDEKKILERYEEDPLYKDHFLPRKFKIAVAIPPNNDVDVFTNDIGLIAIVKNKQLKGFNITIGGGLSTTPGNSKTYARLGTLIGFADKEEKILKVVYETLKIQRDYGDRNERNQARLKYTFDKYGDLWFKNELEKRCGFFLKNTKVFIFTDRSDLFGWNKDSNGFFYSTIFIENGRVFDEPPIFRKTFFLKIAKLGKVQFRLSCHQNIIFSDVRVEYFHEINLYLEKYGINSYMEILSKIRKNSMACVAFNTCPLAYSESQRYFPIFLSKIYLLLKKHLLNKEKIIIRITGCSNGCSRPYVAEIGLIGSSYGCYNINLGGDKHGLLLNKSYKENINETEIIREFDILFAYFSSYTKDNLVYFK
ncbi:MAG TPA: NADPH-dependent assimilatory sulfite reductase hemoprotein subunit [Blattabacteriaceae bacterium]